MCSALLNSALANSQLSGAYYCRSILCHPTADDEPLYINSFMASSQISRAYYRRPIICHPTTDGEPLLINYIYYSQPFRYHGRVIVGPSFAINQPTINPILLTLATYQISRAYHFRPIICHPTTSDEPHSVLLFG